jgi:hypothetical protein
MFGQTKDESERTVPIRFESCTVIFDWTEVEVWGRSPKRPILSTTRYTVPLGALTGGEVMKQSLCLSPVMFRPCDSKEQETWTVVLDTKSNVILSETHEDLNNTTKTESQKSALMMFSDESIANRVLEAFKHAANLCPKKEAF